DSQTINPPKNTLGVANKPSLKQNTAMTSSTLSYATNSSTNSQPQQSLIAPDVTSSPDVIGDLELSASITPPSSSSALAAPSNGSIDKAKCPQSFASPENNASGGNADTKDPDDPSAGVSFQSQSTSVTADSAARASASETGKDFSLSSTTAKLAQLESSLLLKPYPVDCQKLDSSVAASMATPKSLQSGSENSTCISPLDMLIAALDPKKPQLHPPTDATTTATALDASIADGFWNTSMSGSQGQYSGITWDTISSSAASAAAAAAAVATSANMSAHPFDTSASSGLLPVNGGYQVDTLGECMAAGQHQQQQQQDYSDFGHGLRRGSFPPGIKRPYSDFENLLSAADMYSATGSHPPMSSDSNSAFSPHPHPSKHARHSSLISDASMTSAAMESAAAA
ncbi:hypothetical protein LPJ75_006095, partial [Coemansia sp. RSA 2598]